MIIGILGGGQLSRMLALAGIPMGLEFVFFEPNQPCCSESLGEVIYADYKDFDALGRFVKKVDIVSFENENIPEETIRYLKQFKPVYPDKNPLKTCQDRLLEKQLFQSLNIPTTAFYPIDNKEDLRAAVSELGFPCILKKRSGGYDGKGQYRLYDSSDINELSEENCQNTIVEAFVEFDREVSVIAAQDIDKQKAFYDIAANEHKQGILYKSVNKSNDGIFPLAKQYAENILEKWSYVGVLAIEFFQKGDKLIANEMAPRVHNTGHWTIEGAVTSQFENHIRAIINWPLGDTRSLAYTTMYNIIGHFPDKKKLLNLASLHVHDYQKAERKGRKLGHITYLSQSPDRSIQGLEQLLG